MTPKVSIIIPFLNEEENISSLVESLNLYFSKKKEFQVEILFINDGSTDNSVLALRQQKHIYYECKIISLSKNFGSHAALRAGIMQATGAHICFIYADLQDPLFLIDKLYEESKKGNDICWATREKSENGFFEKMFSKAYSLLMKKFVIASYPEKGFDIVMFNKKIQECINQNVEGNSSIFLQILSLGFKQSSIYYQKEARKKGKSKWTLGKKVKLLIDSFLAFSYTPIRLVTMLGSIMFFICSVFSIY